MTSSKRLRQTLQARIRTPHFVHAMVATGLGLLLWNLYRLRFFVHDDAYISLRYARHLVDQGDLSWNLGERVEGYTNFLHLLLVAVGIKIGVEPVAAARLVNAIALAALFGCLARGVVSLTARAPVQALATLLSLSSYALVVWTYGALEPVMTAALLAAALLGCLRCAREAPLLTATWTGLAFGAAYLTRPDALIQGVAAGLTLLLVARREERPASLPQRFRLGVCLALAPWAVVGCHVAWRIGYYGETMPNTYHAKVGMPASVRFTSLWQYLPESFLWLPVLAAALALGLWQLRKGARQRPELWLCGAMLLAHVAYVVWSGGDHMPAARVLLPAFAPALFLVVISLDEMSERARHAAVPLTAFVGVLLALAGPTLKEDPPAYIGKITGAYMRDHWPAGSLVALSSAGATPYVAEDLVFLDMLGLSDRAIGKRPDVPMRLPRQRWPGHGKGDGRYVLDRQPDFIVLGIAEGLPRTRPWFLSDLELSELPEFEACYGIQRRQIPYEVPEAQRQGVINPLNFFYYERTCPRTVPRSAPHQRERESADTPGMRD
ncbi:MAG: hypothetical protein AAF690_24520 [Acidobacteriota bacterium]